MSANAPHSPQHSTKKRRSRLVWHPAAMLKLLGTLLWLCLQVGATHAQTAPTAQNLGDPVAYCLSTLAECTPNIQKAFEAKYPAIYVLSLAARKTR